MADASKTIDLIFNGVDKTSAATKAVLSNIDSLTGSVKTITQPVADFTVGAAKLEAGIMATGAAMTAFAVKTAGDFDGSFRQISTLFDASDKDVARFRDSVQQYAAGSSKSMADVMASFSAAIGAGVDYRDSVDLISQSERLAVATRADLKGTTEVLVSTLNSYGMSTADAGKVSDILFQTIKDGKIEMGDLSQSLSMITPISAAAGVKLSEIGAAVAALTAAGMQPSMAIEYLRSMLSNIIKPSESAAEAAKAMGIAFDAQALKTRGLSGMLDDLAKATGGNSGQMAKLVGDVGGLAAAQALAGPQLVAYKTSLEHMAQSAGSTAEAYGKMAGSMDVELGKVTAAFTGMFVTIGDPLLQRFGSLAQALAGIFQAIGASVQDSGLKSVADYLGKLGDQMGAALAAVAKNLPAALAAADFSGFTKGIDAVVQAFGTLFSGIDLTTVSGLQRAIELAGAAFLGLSRYVAGVIESFRPLFETLERVGLGLAKMDGGVFGLAGQFGGFVTQANLLARGLADLLPALEALVDILVLKQGMSLVGGLVAAASGTTSLVSVLAGPAGMVAGTAVAAAGIAAIVAALIRYADAQSKLQEAQLRGQAIQERAIPTLERFAETTGLSAKSIDEAMRLVEGGQVVWSTAVNGWVKAGDALADVADAASGVANPFEVANQKMLEAYTASGKAAGGVGELAGQQANVKRYALESVPVYDALTGALTGYEQRLVESAKGTIELGRAHAQTAGSLGQTAEQIKKAEEAQRAWNQEVQKMQFQEKLELIKSTTSITVAQIEADARKVTAAFESINTTITSTGQLLSELYKQLGNYNLTGADQFRIRDQIDLENKRRQDALDLQKKLTLSIIAEMEARTKALDAGQALITINGDGLAPHLEAFMWEVLKAVQTRVNRDGLSMLLGM